MVPTFLAAVYETFACFLSRIDDFLDFWYSITMSKNYARVGPMTRVYVINIWYDLYCLQYIELDSYDKCIIVVDINCLRPFHTFRSLLQFRLVLWSLFG